MHGLNNGNMATRCWPNGELSRQGCAKRPDAQESMVTSSTQYGERLENPPQSTTRQRQRAGDAQTNMESIRSPRNGHRLDENQSCEKKRLASLGHASHIGREPLHPQEQADMVNIVRPSGPVSTENVLQLLTRCALTGRSLTPDIAALDHIMPIRYGGEHVIENAQILHKDVNRAKGSLTNEEFIGLCHEVAQYSDIPHTQKESL